MHPRLGVLDGSLPPEPDAMNDLLLHRALRSGALDASASPAIVAVLRAIAKRPVAERIPWLGVLDTALSDSRAEVREAALGVLAGARGRPAIEAMTAALDDPSAEVRAAAVGALAVSAAGVPTTWALVLFHHDPSVRRLALARTAPVGCADLPF